MINILSKLKFYIVLIIFWFLLTLNFTPLNIFFGLIICIFVTNISYGILYDKNGFKFKGLNVINIVKYFFNLLFEIYKSSFTYIPRIIKKDCEPFIVDIELEVTDPLIISIISNSITLTPGTITVSTNGNKLKIVTLRSCYDCELIVEKEIKEKFEKHFIEGR